MKLKYIVGKYWKNTDIAVAFSSLKSSLKKSLTSIAKRLIFAVGNFKLKEICDKYCKNIDIAVAFSPLGSTLNKSVMSIAKTVIL